MAKTFGYKCAWLALRTKAPNDVIAALELRDVREVDWDEGVEAAYAGRFFVTPPLDDWTLVANTDLMDTLFDSDNCPDLESFANRLETTAKRLDAVSQFFATHRVIELHAWAVADPKGLRRAFAYLGERDEVLFDTGAVDPAEKRSRLLLGSDSPASETEQEWSDDLPTEEDVMRVARRWSLVLDDLDDDRLPARGWVARSSGLWARPRATPASEVPQTIDPGCPRSTPKPLSGTVAAVSLACALLCLGISVRYLSHGWAIASSAFSIPPALWLGNRLIRKL
jgi:hypothetical protein